MHAKARARLTSHLSITWSQRNFLASAVNPPLYAHNATCFFSREWARPLLPHINLPPHHLPRVDNHDPRVLLPAVRYPDILAITSLPVLTQERAPSQTIDFPTERTASSFPRNATRTCQWEHRSP
jgi:hypothetical protein